MKLKYDFGGWATKANMLCSDGRTILRDAFKDTKDNVGYWIYYDEFFMGKKMKFGESTQKLALFKKTAGEYERIDAEDDGKNWGYSGIELHEHPVLDGKTGKISGKIEHRENKGLEPFIKKHNEFSSWEASRYFKTKTGKEQLTFRQKVKYSLLDTWLLCHIYFIYIFFFKLGFLDGKTGYIYANLKKVKQLSILVLN